MRFVLQLFENILKKLKKCLTVRKQYDKIRYTQLRVKLKKRQVFIMKEIKNVKNCKLDTLAKRLIELQEIIAPYEEEIASIKNEIKARDIDGVYTYECDTCTVTSRVSTSERLDTKKIKEVFPNWQQYTSTSISHTVKVNPKKSKKK